jgi:hypothetical protein
MSDRQPNDNFVIYAYYREGADRFGRENTIYYVGKGRPKRPYCSANRRVPRPKDRKYIKVIHNNLLEDVAFEYEKALIQFYGRADLYPEWGVLRNMTNGGEGTSGRVVKESTKRIMSEKMSGKNSPHYGKRGELSHHYGVKRSEEAKRRMSLAQMGPNSYSYKPRDWYHEVYGIVLSKSVSEMARLFPDLKLNPPSLSEVCSGKRSHYKGWRYIGESMRPGPLANSLCDTYHPPALRG